MKIYTKLLLIHWFLLFNNQVSAQKKRLQKDVNFIYWFFQNKETRPYVTPYAKDSTIIYLSGLSSQKINFIKQKLSQDTLVDKECSKNQLVLSRLEKKYINHQLAKMRSQIWQKDLMEKSIIISTDTISAILKKPLPTQLSFFSKYPHGYSFFSRPIFIRNGTICIFYCGYNCSNFCFDEQLLILRKEGDGWMELISLIERIN